MRPGKAILRLSKLGYHVVLAGEKIKVIWQGKNKPDPAQVAPLFESIKANREEAILFLRVQCPKCGEAFFWTSLWGDRKCMNCDPPDWNLLERLFPQTQGVRH